MNKRKLQEIEHPLDYSLWVTLLLTGTVAAVALPDYVKLGVSGLTNTVSGAVDGAVEAVKSVPGKAVSAARSQLPAFVPGSTRTSAIIKNPNMRAALDTIARAEGVRYGYNTLVGNTRVSDLSRHPNICVRFGSRGQCSTAFGRYQFLNKTWYGLMGNAAMTPENQDTAAIKLLRQCGVVDDIIAGKPSWVDDPCTGRVWASFPRNSYGQKQYGRGTLASWFTFYQQQNRR